MHSFWLAFFTHTIILRSTHVVCIHSSLFVLFNSIPLYGYNTICLAIHLLMDHWVVSSFELLETNWTSSQDGGIG